MVPCFFKGKLSLSRFVAVSFLCPNLEDVYLVGKQTPNYLVSLSLILLQCSFRNLSDYICFVISILTAGKIDEY